LTFLTRFVTLFRTNETTNFNISEDQQLNISNSSDWFTFNETSSNPDWLTFNETSSIYDWLSLCFEFQPVLTDRIQILLPFGVGSCFIAILSSAILHIKSKFLQIKISIVSSKNVILCQLKSWEIVELEISELWIHRSVCADLM
jgi:hypothetical protein